MTDPLKVLVACTFRWPGAARLAVDLHQAGWSVDAVAPPGSALHAISAVERSHALGLVDPVRSLRRAIDASAPEVVVPFDDRTRFALELLHARSSPNSESGARRRALLERSLGSPEGIAGAYSRSTLMAVAREAGVLCPSTATVSSPRELNAWLRRNPGRSVLKIDGSWGGRGVAILPAGADGRRAWRGMRRRTSLAYAAKRLLLERDPWALRDRLVGNRPRLSIQPYVEGRPANAAVACFQGAVLGTVQAQVVQSHGRTGPSTVLQLVDNPDMTYAVTSIVRRLGLSGLCGLDFVVDDQGRAHLLELNPRATPTSHLVGVDGVDLLTALRRAHGHVDPPERKASYERGLVALFPQELIRDAASPHLLFAHHDVPGHAPDLVEHVLASLRGRRRTATASSSVPPETVTLGRGQRSRG